MIEVIMVVKKIVWKGIFVFERMDGLINKI